MKSYSQDDLDDAFAQRDEYWENSEAIISRFREVIDYLSKWAKTPKGLAILKSRLRYQADFYSLFGAIDDLLSANKLSQIKDPITKLESFVKIVDDPTKRAEVKWAYGYYEAARSATNDAAPRRTRIDIITSILLGELHA